MSFPTADQLEYTDTGSRVYSYAQMVLGLVSDSAVELALDIPTTQYVTSGEAVAQCEQVVVSGISLVTGLPASTNHQIGIPMPVSCMPIWSMIMNITIMRCGPKMLSDGYSTAEDLNSSFQRSSEDIAILMLVSERLVTGQQFGSITASITMSPPEGGMVATTMRLTAGLT